MKMSSICVIVVTYKFNEAMLKELKRNIINQGIERKALFIIDNTTINRGYSGAVNYAIKKNLDKFKYFLILNPDIHLNKDTIAKLLNEIKSSASNGVVGPKIFDESSQLWVLGGVVDKIRYSAGLIYEKKQKNVKRKIKVDFISGTMMLVRREVFKKIGLLNEDYFLYYEDVDFCYRVKKAGFFLKIAKDAKIRHASSQSVGKQSPALHYYMARNHLLFQERFAPKKIRLREILRLPKTIIESRKRKYELLGIRDYIIRRFGRNLRILSEADYKYRKVQ